MNKGTTREGRQKHTMRGDSEGSSIRICNNLHESNGAELNIPGASGYIDAAEAQ